MLQLILYAAFTIWILNFDNCISCLVKWFIRLVSKITVLLKFISGYNLTGRVYNTTKIVIKIAKNVMNQITPLIQTKTAKILDNNGSFPVRSFFCCCKNAELAVIFFLFIRQPSLKVQ